MTREQKAAIVGLNVIMSVYTVHQPPLRAGAPLEPERFAFVREGFSIWAFLLAPVWMLWHRMWLVLVGYVVIATGLEAAVKALGASAFVIGLIGLLISLLVGLEASTLRRFTLSRRRWRTVGVVSGDDREDAERRFFDGWVREDAFHQGTPVVAASAAAAPAAPIARTLQTPDVVGLFPEPGTQR